MTQAELSNRTPLSVMIFREAMRRELSISDFALELNLSPISLRQFVTGNPQRPRTKTLEVIGGALNMSVDEVREHMEILPSAAPPFGEWLETMMGSAFSRARLGREAKISDGAMRNYLQNDTLPDADQAVRLAAVLEIDPMLIAEIIVANDIVERGGALPAAQPEAVAPVGEPPALVAELVAPAVATPATTPLPPPAVSAPAAAPSVLAGDEERLMGLWRRLHPQGRRATFHYIAELLAEG
jgi:transcriptional regulator with XRE-family HTH domain